MPKGVTMYHVEHMSYTPEGSPKTNRYLKNDRLVYVFNIW